MDISRLVPDRNATPQSTGRWLSAAGVLLALSGGTAWAQDGSDRRFDLEFSLDIGSDTEMSDPASDGDEVFDPGDMYLWRGPFFAGSTNGVRDDKSPYLPWLPTPEPGFAHPMGLPAVAPTCDPAFPLSAVRREYLDVDASDSVDVPFWELIRPDEPLMEPVLFLLTESVHFPKGVILSFDDDGALPYVSCDIPISVASPTGMTYGSTAGRDEVIAFDFGIGIPLVPLGSKPVATEREVHPNMDPNPIASQRDDDDVDALDITHPTQDIPRWPFWLWSVDHEATGTVLSPMAVPNPGHIYWYDGVTMGTLLKADVHFGLINGVDIDAFELIWLTRPSGLTTLASMFSVDEDDPATPGVDESGGLDPAVLYGSFMDGTSFRLVSDAFRDDIDAVAAWCDPLVDDPTWDTTPPCPPDLAPPFGVLNFFDVAAFIALYSASDPAADLAPPFGVFNFFDVSAYIASYSAGCP